MPLWRYVRTWILTGPYYPANHLLNRPSNIINLYRSEASRANKAKEISLGCPSYHPRSTARYLIVTVMTGNHCANNQKDPYVSTVTYLSNWPYIVCTVILIP